MHYFTHFIEYIKENPKKSIFILALDLLFYILFIPMFLLWVAFLTASFNKFSYSGMFSGLQDLDMESLNSVQSSLNSLLMAIFVSIFLLFVLIFLNIAILKGIQKFKTLNKKIKIKTLAKSFVLNAMLFILFIIPLLISLRPLIITNEYGMPQPITTIAPVNFIPMAIVIFITFYFTGIANMRLIQTGRLRKSFIDMFKLGILRVKKLFLPYFFTFVAIIGTLRFLGNLGLIWVEFSWLLFLPLLLILSFMYRLHLSRVL